MRRSVRFLSTVLAAVMLLGVFAGSALATDDGSCPPPPCPGVGTPGYWYNHPEDWPNQCPITIYGQPISNEAALEGLKQDAGDKTYTLFRAVIATKLNFFAGNDYSLIDPVLCQAELWLYQHPLGSGVSGDSEAWQCAETLYLQLDAYNNGLLNCPPRD